MKFELEDYHRNIPDSDLIDDLLKVAKALNKNKVTIDEYNEKGKYHNTTLSRRFGSWFKTLEKAGLEKTRNLNISNEELFENLETVWRTLGRQPKYNEVIKPLSKYSVGTYDKRFGSWRKGLQEFVNYINNDNIESINSTRVNVPSDLKHRTNKNVNWRLRFLVMRRDNFKCKICGRSPASDLKVVLHIDHIKPWSKGGETVFENLQTLCSICNIGKSNIL